jgi:DNA-binding NtrC family response regulator
MEEMINMVRKTGAYALLEKPINIDRLLLVLEQIESQNRKKEPD